MSVNGGRYSAASESLFPSTFGKAIKDDKWRLPKDDEMQALLEM